MNSIVVSTKDLPAHIAAHVNARSVTVYLCEHVSIGSQQWSEGSRDLYHVASLDSPIVKPVEDARPWPNNMGELGRTEIAPRFVVIKTGTFCGRDATPMIWARPEDISPQLAKPAIELDLLQQGVLVATATLNSMGRKRWRDDFGVSQQRWDAATSRLKSLGLVEKRGSGYGATINGTNAARKLDSHKLTNPYAGTKF